MEDYILREINRIGELIAAVRRQLARDRVEAFVQSMAVLGYHRSELPVLLQESGAQAQ